MMKMNPKKHIVKEDADADDDSVSRHDTFFSSLEYWLSQFSGLLD